MYAPPFFQTDRASSLAFAEARGFGLAIAPTDAAPIASPLPFCIGYAADGSPRARFHVARGNPLGQLAEAGGNWLLAVTGDDTYVSPDWYASHDQVPTWLYESVHLSGPVRTFTGDDLNRHLDELSEKFEKWLLPKPIWKTDKMTPARHKQLVKAIVGIEMQVEQVTGSRKHNQHKSDADHVAISRALRTQDAPSAQSIAQQMIAARPQLAYE